MAPFLLYYSSCHCGYSHWSAGFITLQGKAFSINVKLSHNKTRPDTRPSVADGPTDRPADGRTKPLIELRVRN